MARIAPTKIEILIDGKKPSEFFDELNKRLEDSRQNDIGYGTKVQMRGEYSGAIGKINQITINGYGTRYKIVFDTPYSYEDWDGGYMVKEVSAAKRDDFVVL